jgi:hypothetical protein
MGAGAAEGAGMASNPVGWVVAAGLGGYTVGSMISDTYRTEINNAVEWVVGDPMAAGGRGERGATGGTSGQNTANPYKHCKIDPTNPNFIICKNHQTGKDVRKPKPADWPKEKTACP